jgi:hypothetical protein
MLNTNYPILHWIILLFFIPIHVSCNEIHDIDDAKNDGSMFLENQKIERFEIRVDTSNPNIKGSSVNLEKEIGLIMLPIGYSAIGKPTKLIIYCHSGSGTVTENYSEVENDKYCKYFVSLGYAVMDVSGLPKTYTDRMRIDYGRTVGSFIAVRSYVEGYNYVVQNYNIDPNGCYVFANSSGGLVSLNLGNLTKIPILAQAGICPLLSIEHNAWNITLGAMTGGQFTAYQIRANIIRIYGMQNVQTQNELNNAKYEKEKVGIYDPFDFILNQSSEPYPYPYKIFQTKDDAIVYYKLAEKLVQIDNSRRGNMVLRSFEKGSHTAEPLKDTLGYFNYMKKKFPINTSNFEVATWFEQHNGNQALLVATSIEQNLSEKIELYPNPVIDSFRINVPEASKVILIIFDMNGRVLYNNEISNNELVSIESFEKGSYIARIITNSETRNKVLIKI